MAFEPKSAEIELKYTKPQNTETIPVVMTLTSNDGAISRVISVSANPFIESVVPSAGNAQIDGKLCVKVLVEKVEGGFSCLEGINNFTVHLMNKDINIDSEIFATAKLLSVNSVQASEQAVTFTSNILVKPIMLASEKIKYIAELPLAQQKKDIIEYTDVVAGTAQDFDLNLELDLPSSISKILCVESKVVLSKAEAGNDLVVLHGENYTNMIYLTADEQPKLKSQKYAQEFNHELLANNITTADVVTATLQNAVTQYELQGELSSTKGTILLKNQLKANIFVRQNKSYEAVVDAFCPNYLLNNEYSSFVSQKLLSSDLNFEKIDGSIVLGEDSPRIDKVLAVCAGNVVVKSSEISDDGIKIAGALNCNIIYVLDDDNASTQSVFAEVPFNINLKKNGINDDNSYKLNIVAKEIEARNKKSKEIDILAELAIETTILNNVTEANLQAVTLGDKRTQNASAMGVYIVSQAQDLWEVSKALAVPSELIMEQNPDLQFPITSPQRLIIYREKRL